MSLETRLNALAARVGAEFNALRAEAAPPDLVMPSVAGDYLDQALTQGTYGTLNGAAGRLQLTPFWTPRAISYDLIGAQVTTGQAGALLRVLVYAPDASGWPDALDWVSADLDASTAGGKFDTRVATFEPFTLYWLGLWHSSTATVRSIAQANARSLGLSSGVANTHWTMLQRVVSFGGSAPDPWTFAAGERTISGIPSIRFRVA